MPDELMIRRVPCSSGLRHFATIRRTLASLSSVSRLSESRIGPPPPGLQNSAQATLPSISGGHALYFGNHRLRHFTVWRQIVVSGLQTILRLLNRPLSA